MHHGGAGTAGKFVVDYCSKDPIKLHLDFSHLSDLDAATVAAWGFSVTQSKKIGHTFNDSWRTPESAPNLIKLPGVRGGSGSGNLTPPTAPTAPTTPPTAPTTPPTAPTNPAPAASGGVGSQSSSGQRVIPTKKPLGILQNLVGILKNLNKNPR